MHIKLLHRDESGLSSVEYTLAIPTFLIILLVIMDLGKYRTAMLHTVIESRNAAITAGLTPRICLSIADLPPLIDQSSTLLPETCRRTPVDVAGSRFWQGLDQAGSERLTNTTTNAEVPELVTATARLVYQAHDWPAISMGPFEHETTFASRLTFTHKDTSLRVGYDSEMQARFDESTGNLMSMFPNVFMGAAR